MTWAQGKVSYYADFLLVPFLVGLSFMYVPRTLGSLVLLAAGFLLWTFSEYAIHRWLGHAFMREQHWLHHMRPTGYVAPSGLLTAAIHIMLMIGAFLSGTVALFVGIEISYFLYIWTHDRIHHAANSARLDGVSAFSGRWMDWRAWLHDVHHRGVEANFGVVFSWWDHLFGTYCHPLRADAWLEHQRQQRRP